MWYSKMSPIRISAPEEEELGVRLMAEEFAFADAASRENATILLKWGAACCAPRGERSGGVESPYNASAGTKFVGDAAG